MKTRERVASDAGVGQGTVQRAADYARAVDTLAADSPTIKRLFLALRFRPFLQPHAGLYGLVYIAVDRFSGLIRCGLYGGFLAFGNDKLNTIIGFCFVLVLRPGTCLPLLIFHAHTSNNAGRP